MFRLPVHPSLVVLFCLLSGCLSAAEVRGQVAGGASRSPQTRSAPSQSSGSNQNAPRSNQIPGREQQQDLSVPAHAAVRSQLFHLKPGDGFDVTASSADARFSVDLYVYNGGHVLVGKDDPDAVETSFRWNAAEEGDYYVLGRNLSGGSGTVHLARIAGGHSGVGTRGLTPVEPSGNTNYAVVKVLYATDRNRTGGDSRGATFGGEPDPAGTLHYGEVWVSIPRDHRMGELEGPSIWRLQFREDASKDVVLQHVETEDEAGFLKGVSDRLAHSQKKEILVFVHGFNTTFEDASRRTAQIAYDMAYDGPAILYSWPSQGSITPIAYNKDGRNAALTVPHLEAFLKLLVARSGATTIDLIAHSLGNRPVTQALHDFALENPGEKNNPPLNQVALMAPDMDAALFQQMAQSMELSAHHITLYASSRDAALRISNLFAGYQRAGEGVPHLLVVPGMDTVDASAVDTSLLGLYHSYFADSTTILSDLFRDFSGVPPASRKGLQAVVTAAGKYWRFIPAG